jgi:ABC-type amino acid transport substrate-binding protein/ABC-type amino acid transport system permease subunit
MKRLRALVGTAVIAALALAGAARADRLPDAALASLLDQARTMAAAPDACSRPDADRLVGIYCADRIRVGVREYYPLFGSKTGEVWEGYEIDVARAIGAKLGVAVDFEKVKAATRIQMLADDGVDLVIATMGHNTERDTQARFIRPHYYQSETVLVGPRDLAIGDWRGVAGHTVCVTVGNGSNAELVSRGARLMLFSDTETLQEHLDDRTCTLAAQDDSFFAYYFADPSFAARFSTKFGFSQVPWGMAVARRHSDNLARALDLISQIFHRDGVFLDAARVNHVGAAFLVRQQAVWARPECNTDSGSTNPACVLPPFDTALQPTPFAGTVAACKHWLKDHLGIELSLPMFETAPAWSLFLNGMGCSLGLIGGALVATLGFALLFGAAMAARSWALRWPARGITAALQSSPILLTLAITAAVIHTLVPYSPEVAVVAAILALGLANGSNAGQAISEAYFTLREERPRAGAGHLFLRALSRSATQIVAFLINAAKGTPIASFIGAPELLGALTDITSFSSGRATTYTLLLVFYTGVVILVVWLCRRFQLLLERGWAAA